PHPTYTHQRNNAREINARNTSDAPQQDENMTDSKAIDRKMTLLQRPKDADNASDVSFDECLKLAQELKEFSRLPLSCRRYIDKKAILHQACEGMTGDQQVAQVSVARNSKIGRNMTHAQLQRRLTARENPLRKNSRK
ncbi:unnamed protein product, partial [Scytosiphon promiscuus]